MKISVLTPCFNSGDFIERGIKSVLKQNYKNFEHIIVDGNSTDNTLEILKKYDHLNWISEPDEGQSDAMNKAFNMSTGEIIVYLNADDEFEEGIFQLVADKFNENKGVDMVVGNLRFIWPHKTFVRCPTNKYADVILYWKNLFPQNPVSYFYKREVQEGVGEFPLKYHYTMDYWFLLKSYKSGKILKVEKVFGNFYNNGLNKTATTDSVGNSHKTLMEYLLKDDIKRLPWFLIKYWMLKLYPYYLKVNPWKRKKVKAKAAQ